MSNVEQAASVNWLFVKGSASIRIEQAPDTALVVHGPGTEQQIHRFRDDAERTRFQADLERRLRAEGWQFEGHAVERRRLGDRRRMARAGLRARRSTEQPT